jgi:hypothetical protein
LEELGMLFLPKLKRTYIGKLNQELLQQILALLKRTLEWVISLKQDIYQLNEKVNTFL